MAEDKTKDECKDECKEEKQLLEELNEETNIPEGFSDVIENIPPEHRKQVTQMMISAVQICVNQMKVLIVVLSYVFG